MQDFMTDAVKIASLFMLVISFALASSLGVIAALRMSGPNVNMVRILRDEDAR